MARFLLRDFLAFWTPGAVLILLLRNDQRLISSASALVSRGLDKQYWFFAFLLLLSVPFIIGAVLQVPFEYLEREWLRRRRIKLQSFIKDHAQIWSKFADEKKDPSSYNFLERVVYLKLSTSKLILSFSIFYFCQREWMWGAALLILTAFAHWNLFDREIYYVQALKKLAPI